MFILLIIFCLKITEPAISTCIPLPKNGTDLLLSNKFASSSAKIFLKSYPGYYKIDNFLFKLGTCSCENSRKNLKSRKRKKKRRFVITPFPSTLTLSNRLTPYQVKLINFRIQKAKKIVKKNKQVDKKLMMP